MNTHSNKTKQENSKSITNDITHKDSGGEYSLQFTNSYKEGIKQRKLQAMANNSPQVENTNTLLTKVHSKPTQRQTNIRKKSNKTGLPDNLKSDVEYQSGYSLDDVNVHYNSNKPAQLNANAYAQGTNIYLSPGQEKHLPHEAWHVVQQKQGRVKPSLQLKEGISVNNDKKLEQEADAFATKTKNSGKEMEGELSLLKGQISDVSAPIQGDIGFEFELEVPLYICKDDPDKFFAQREDTKYAKSKKLHNQKEFHIVQDHSAKGNDGINTIPEFVIHPMSEDNYLEDFLENVEAAYNYINSNQGILDLGSNTYVGTGMTGLSTSKVGGAQATYGVRPEGIESIFKEKAKQMNSEEKSPLMETDILNNSVIAANSIMSDKIFDEIRDTPDISKIKGYILLICQYCVSNSFEDLQKSKALDKNKVPFLIRSSLGEIAKATMSEKALFFLSNNSVSITDIIIKATKAKKGTPVISITSSEKDPVRNVNVEKWVYDALNASDDTLKWGSETNNEDSIIISPEETGSFMNSPDNKRTMGAVVEERNLISGQIAVNKWVEHAARIWKKVCTANLESS